MDHSGKIASRHVTGLKKTKNKSTISSLIMLKLEILKNKHAHTSRSSVLRICVGQHKTHFLFNWD